MLETRLPAQDLKAADPDRGKDNTDTLEAKLGLFLSPGSAWQTGRHET